jgi:hypothetical protein
MATQYGYTHENINSRYNDTATRNAPLDFLPVAAEQQQLLDEIDELRAAGVGVKLPQIVVVRDQSSGKSSVLEALTQLRFPAAAKLCTRLATEIKVRRSIDEKLSVSIIPGPGRRAEAHHS